MKHNQLTTFTFADEKQVNRCMLKLKFHGTDTDNDTDTDAPIV